MSGKHNDEPLTHLPVMFHNHYLLFTMLLTTVNRFLLSYVQVKSPSNITSGVLLNKNFRLLICNVDAISTLLINIWT